ncbi:MAG TPA: phage holin family protein [Jatrophihabitans sp.]|nr:phage holin family protein [Jatrophihabitans sp.]
MSHALQPQPPVHTHSAELDDASVGQLTARLGEQVSQLVRDELALAKLEATRKAKIMGLGAGMLGAGGVLALFGTAAGIAAAIIGISYALPAWLATVVVAAGLFMGAGMAALLGKVSISKAGAPVPTEAIESTKADVSAVRGAIHR